jgi:regulator of protease activity HflC (stomatin/prohibitin superfamily)
MAEGALGVCGGLVCVGFLVLAFSSFTTIAPTEMALLVNGITQTVRKEVVVDPGIHCVGPWTTVVKYPRTSQNMYYDRRHRDILDGRTQDGLPLLMGVTFQYKLLPEGLYDLYHKFETNIGDYVNVFQLAGIHIITEYATNFTAYQFFNDKMRITTVMQEHLDHYFMEEFHATVVSLQINEDDLPDAFTDTIRVAANIKQNVSRMQRLKEAKVVELQTAVNVAWAQRNVTIQRANGKASAIKQNGDADANIIKQYVSAELGAYKKVQDRMNLSGQALLDYMWYDTLAGGGVNAQSNAGAKTQVFVGVDPAAYINQKGT